MCTLFIAKNVGSKYKLIFMGNRDEFYKRPTLASHFWSENKKIYGGRDLLSCGSWTAINKNGKIAFLTNYRDFTLMKDEPISRGKLVYDYLKDDSSPIDYIYKINKDSKLYDPYNIIVGDTDNMYYYNNVNNSMEIIEDGIHGLSNGFLNTPWNKVLYGKMQLAYIVDKEFNIKDLFDIMENEEEAKDKDLPKTGLSYEKEKLLSRLFIRSSSYGTMVTTLILIDNNNVVQYIEKNQLSKDIKYRSFKII